MIYTRFIQYNHLDVDIEEQELDPNIVVWLKVLFSVQNNHIDLILFFSDPRYADN